ncbi:hypothetical protein ANCCAN_04180 [Ancylostoma caninum]|uniref:Uncharacterized protein n=1 Tax=Ancylostoma caninum TaxID=29170 RepID=A0A368GZF9_ANCCA|nr:hypothetical protein ANCCAN_04180 [Ancylostoma caninum]
MLTQYLKRKAPSSLQRIRDDFSFLLDRNCSYMNIEMIAREKIKARASLEVLQAPANVTRTFTPYQGDLGNKHDKNKHTNTAPRKEKEYESEIAIFLALGGAIAAVFVLALVVILVVIILVSNKKRASKKTKKSKPKHKDKAPSSEEKSNEKSSERSLRLSQEAVRTFSPPADYNKLTYGLPGYSDNISLSRHALPDRALGIREDQEGYVLRSDAEIRRMKLEQERELKRVEEEFRSMSEREMDDDERDEQDRGREDSNSHQYSLREDSI